MKNRLFVQFISFIMLTSLIFLGVHSYFEQNQKLDHFELVDQPTEEDECLKKYIEDDFFPLKEVDFHIPIQALSVLFPNPTERLPIISHFRHYPPPNEPT
ncbi:hypothetical protein SMI01S_00040 [Sphingobacterium mizutaii NBRC 14946 = DSM 11724]|nr:hypothetical protein [Sphingobacterium mizutaii]GEM66398.1 hypothetical protein SMI01S_00040 [Sphingobacterium mizutaii NBRC 14946 = DSM 11724]